MAATDVNPSFKFSVEIDNVPVAAFLECTLPGLQIDTEKIQDGGNNDYVHNLPKGVQPGNLTLKHGLVKGDAMLKWWFQVAQLNMKDVMKSITVVMYGSDNSPIMHFN